MRTISAGLVQLDASVKKNAPNPRAVRDMFRALHTIKGLAAMVGVDPIVDIAHAMETVLRTADKSGGRIVAASLDPLIDASKAIGVRLRALSEGTAVPAAPAQVIAALAGQAPDAAAPPPTLPALTSIEPELLAKLSPSEREQLGNPSAGCRAWILPFHPSVELTTAGISITVVRQRVAELGELVKVLPTTTAKKELRFVLFVLSAAEAPALAAAASCSVDQVVPLQPELPPAPVFAELAEDDRLLSSNTLRVHVDRLDEAMERFGALMVNRFRLGRAIEEAASKGLDVRQLREIAEESRRQLLEMRRAMMSLRMVALSTLLDPLPLLVRGLSSSTSKPAILQREVGDVEVDKAVAEPLWQAIVHLIRNAVDHGLELSDVRAARGKPAQGTIKVSCVERSNSQVEIVIADDGGGIDRQRVAERANAAVPHDDAALLDLMTIPGLSTRDEADATSGRGMGLDIVRRVVVEQLRGELRVRTAPGLGTTFTIRVPVTLSVVDTFRFESGGQSFLVPVSIVEELIEVESAALMTTPSPSGVASVAVLRRRGAAIPLLDLSAMFGAPHPPQCPKAIIVRSSDSLFAFGVDRMLGHQEVVVRPLRDPLVRVPGVVGATDLGEGKPTLVLDLVALTRGFSALEGAA